MGWARGLQRTSSRTLKNASTPFISFWLEFSLGSGIILTLTGTFKGPDSQALMRCDCRHPERLRRANFHLSFRLSGLELPSSQSSAGPPLPTVKPSSCLLERSGWWSPSIHVFCSCTCDLERRKSFEIHSSGDISI